MFTSTPTSTNQDAMNMRKQIGATCHAGSVPMERPAVADKAGVYSKPKSVLGLVQKECDRDVSPRPKSLRIKSASP